MEICNEINKLIDNYIAEVNTVIENSKPSDGLLGFGSGPKDHPCHMDFYNKMEALMQSFAASSPDADSANAAAEILIKCSSEKPCPQEAYWMLVVIQQLATPTIKYLSSDERSALKSWYDDNIPRRTRLPIQKTLYKELSKK